MLVYIIYNNIHKSVYHVYEDEDEAIYTMNNLNSFENNNIIIEASLSKYDNSKFHYSEEDNNIDEEDYDFIKDENKNLKNKVEDYEKVIKRIKEEYNELSQIYIDEEDYDFIKDENKNLKNKVEDYEKVIKRIKEEYNELSQIYINESIYSYIFLIIMLILMLLMCILFMLE